MRTAVRLSSFDLAPGPGLTRSPDDPSEWAADAPRVAFTLPGVPAGWYRLRVRARMGERLAVRKRGELSADGRRVEAFEWNRDLAEDLIVRLPDSDELRLDLHHAAGRFRLTRFDLRRVGTARATARALRLKLRLISSYQCFWPVVARGGRLLAKGDVRTFGRKLLKGISDSRTMRVGVKQAAEASAAWWRRSTLTADQFAALVAEAAALPDPPPIAVVIPADPTRTDHARHALLSVYRQAYPHWEALVPWPTAAVPDELTSAIGWDDRGRIVVGDGLADATRKALARARADRVLILPPDWEVTEHGLLRFAQAVAGGGPGAVACTRPDAPADTSLPIAPAVLPVPDVRAAAAALPAGVTAAGVARWAAGLVSDTVRTVPEPLVVPLDRSCILARRGMADRPREPLGELVLAGDVRGLSGWDHVTYAVLTGLHSLGVEVRRHPGANVQPHLLPPGVTVEPKWRTPADPQLVVAPPFLAGRFAIDAATAVLTMWEVDRIDPPHAAMLSRARVVIVPSAWGADCFRASGVTAPIEVVPLGYDPLVFYPTGEARPPSPPRGEGGKQLCVFGTAGALSAGGLRKNVRRVVDLFRAAFPAEPDVRLRVKITPNCPPFDIPDDPRVEVTRATLPHAELAAWNRSLTAYVNASFAEGFGFHLLEAMACGVPVVSARATGLTAFFDEAVGYVVPHRWVAATNDVYRGRWADPDDAALVAAMRAVRDDRAAARDKGDAAAARARRFTWRDAGRQLAAVLEKYDLVRSRP